MKEIREVVSKLPVVLVWVSSFFLSGCLGLEHPMVSVSMEPTVIKGDFIQIGRWPLLIRNPKRWEIVVFANEYTKDRLWVFRVIGMPGETLQITPSGILVDGKALEFPEKLAFLSYIPTKVLSGRPLEPPYTSYNIPEEHYFLLGDNTRKSNDSRFMGALPRNEIVGVISDIRHVTTMR